MRWRLLRRWQRSGRQDFFLRPVPAPLCSVVAQPSGTTGSGTEADLPLPPLCPQLSGAAQLTRWTTRHTRSGRPQVEFFAEATELLNVQVDKAMPTRA